jgi:hypothetical protein
VPEAADLLGPEQLAESRPDRSALLRLRCIGCEVLARPIYLCAAMSPRTVDVSLLRIALHETPATLRARLQAEIDAAGPEYDAVVLAYGLCGGATVGLAAGRVPLIVPRAHDCITVFLGSRERYQREFAKHPGTYWYAADYLERSDREMEGASTGLFGVGASTDAELQAAYAEYLERFGRDNADYLMETMGAWREHYDRAVLLDLPIGGSADAERRAKAEAERRGWLFERVTGDLLLIRRLLEADWADDFLVLQPGQRLAMSYDAEVVRAIAGEEAALL